MAVLLHSIQSVLSIILLMALGYFLKKKNMVDASFSKNISGLITKVALPSSIFVAVLHKLTRDKLISLSGSLFYPVLAVAIGYAFAYALVKILKIRPGRRGTFINAVVNANTVFIGLPLNLALFGEKSMPYFLVYYIVNTVSTWAIGVFIWANDDPTKVGQEKNHKVNWKKILPPPLIGFIIALIFLIGQIPVPGFIDSTLEYVGNLVTPLSLIYIGIVLRDAGLKSMRFEKDSVAALLARFILFPVIMIVLLLIGTKGFGFNVNSLLQQTLIVQSATPMLAVSPILAAESNGDVEYATNLVVTSTILFIVVVPILMQLIQFM